MYKWLSGSVTPPASYFPHLVRIVCTQTSEARQLILTKDLRALIGESGLPKEIRTTVLAAGSLESLLFECLELSVMPNVKSDLVYSGVTESRLPWWLLLGALFAATTGGILWNALNRILEWPYFMDGGNNALRGFHAFLWGGLTTASIPVPLFLQHRFQCRRFLLPAVLFTVVASLCALVFYTAGIRGAIEGLSFSYAVQELCIVVLFALCMSGLPLVAAVLTLPRVRSVSRLLFILVLPTVAAVVSFLVTLIIERPVGELLQLRGFVVGFALRLAMFISLFLSTQTLTAENALPREFHDGAAE